MRICLVDGSPKHKDSASHRIIESLESKLGGNLEYRHCNTASVEQQELLSSMRGCDIIVIVFPLYIDGIPSHLLRLLCSIEPFAAETAHEAKLYVIAHNGFYEAHHNQTALDMMRNFCDRAGLGWGQGAGIGASPFIHAVPAGKGPNKNMGRTLDILAGNIISGQSSDNIFSKPNMPRFLYTLGGNMGWKNQAKRNGVKRKDLQGN